MANNYEQSTVQPVLPKTLFTDLELKTLAALGMDYEPSFGSDREDCFYFFSEESSWGDDIEIDPDIYTAMLQDKDNYVVAQYLDYFEANDIQADENNIITVNLEEINDDTDSESELTSETIFRAILRKQGCEIDEIVIMGAFTCDKLRPGEFGGFVTRITKDKIQQSGTYQILEEMRHPKKRQLAVVMQGGLIQAIVSHQPENIEVLSIDYDTDGYDESDLTLVKQSDGNYSQAYCVNECIQEPVIDLNQVTESMNATQERWIIRRDNADNKRKENQNV